MSIIAISIFVKSSCSSLIVSFVGMGIMSLYEYDEMSISHAVIDLYIAVSLWYNSCVIFNSG